MGGMESMDGMCVMGDMGGIGEGGGGNALTGAGRRG